MNTAPIDSQIANTSAEFFDSMYRREADPWNFAASPYEQSRYQATIAALGHRRYTRAFEPGCSIGVLTQRLADICETVEAIEISPAAVEQARTRCQSQPNVHITAAALPDYVPDPPLDLIVLSEIGYYFREEDLRALATGLIRSLTPGGTLLAVHWLGHSPDHILSGDQVHETLLALPDLNHDLAERHPSPGSQAGFRLDCWTRAGTPCPVNPSS